jgi:hypothetical protein
MTHRDAPRWFNFVLGAWMVASVLVWPHSASQFANAWLVGAAMMWVALLAKRAIVLRFATFALAAWLFISAWVLPLSTPSTLWNDVLVAVVMWVVAMLTHEHVTRSRPPRA